MKRPDLNIAEEEKNHLKQHDVDLDSTALNPPKNPIVLKKTLNGRKIRLVNRVPGEGVDNPLPVPEKDIPVTKILSELIEDQLKQDMNKLPVVINHNSLIFV